MVLRTFVAFTLLMTIACGGKSPPPKSEATAPVAKTEPAPPAEPVATDKGDIFVAQIGAFKDQVCACADSACVEQAERDMMEWAMKNMEEIKTLKPTKEQDELADKYSGELDACKAKIEESSASAAPPVEADAVLTKMAEFKDQVCRCKDKACVDHVEEGMLDWAMKNMESMKNMKPTQAQEDAANKIEADMDACKARIK